MTIATWDVRTDTGALVTGLDVLAESMGTDVVTAAKSLLADPVLLDSAPAELQREVKAFTKKPGGGTPPPITSGSFVSWDGGKGRVDLVVSKGKVPGVEDDVEGTGKSPAARVVVWEDGKPTRKKIAVSTHVLKRIPPIQKKKGAKEDPAAELTRVYADYEATCTHLGSPEYARVSGLALKTAYDRGVGTWPGPAVTDLTRQEWALGRAEHFIKAARGDFATQDAAGHDVDLLDPRHPLTGGLSDDEVLVDLGEVSAEVKALLAVIGDDADECLTCGEE